MNGNKMQQAVGKYNIYILQLKFSQRKKNPSEVNVFRILKTQREQIPRKKGEENRKIQQAQRPLPSVIPNF